MRASAAGKIADPSSAASLENNWIVSAIGPRMARLTAIGWTTICKHSLQATWRFCRRGGGGRKRFWRRDDWKGSGKWIFSLWILMNRVYAKFNMK